MIVFDANDTPTYSRGLAGAQLTTAPQPWRSARRVALDTRRRAALLRLFEEERAAELPGEIAHGGACSGPSGDRFWAGLRARVQQLFDHLGQWRAGRHLHAARQPQSVRLGVPGFARFDPLLERPRRIHQAATDVDNVFVGAPAAHAYDR